MQTNGTWLALAAAGAIAAAGAAGQAMGSRAETPRLRSGYAFRSSQRNPREPSTVVVGEDHQGAKFVGTATIDGHQHAAFKVPGKSRYYFQIWFPSEGSSAQGQSPKPGARSPESDPMALLQPHVSGIQRALSSKTRISRWTTDGAHPSMTLHGNGAAVSFTGTDETAGGGRGPWSVVVIVIGEKIHVEVTAPQAQYPGYKPGQTVARGSVRALENFADLLEGVREPLSLILRS